MILIETLLPQRYPFLFVDEILSATKDEIIGIKTYDNTFLFYQEQGVKKTVPHLLLIESLVQCGGAGVTQMGILDKSSWGLASLENVHLGAYVACGSTIKMIVKTLKVSSTILKQTGTAFCEKNVIAEATWLCLKLL